jgi:hypothetical protein
MWIELIPYGIAVLSIVISGLLAKYKINVNRDMIVGIITKITE